MKCPKCGQNVELQKRPVGTDEDGNPILNEFAICRSCKKKWNLDKQRQKKSVETAAAGSVAPSAAKSDALAKKTAPARKPVSDKAAPQKSAAEKTAHPVKASSTEKSSPSAKRPRRVPSSSKTASDSEARLGNIPSENVRKKREAAVKKNYEDMLNTDKVKSRPSKKKRLDDDFSTPDQVKSGPRLVSKSSAKTAHPSSKHEEDTSYAPVARFCFLRLFLGILSILGGAYFVYKTINARLDDIASGGTVKTATTFAILAACLLLSGIFTLIMRRRVTRVSFLIPLLLCAGAAVFTFLKKQDETLLFYCFIAAAVLAAIYLLLTLLGGEKIDDEDEFYDDDFDDEY